MIYSTQDFQGNIDPKHRPTLLRMAMLRVYIALKVLHGIDHLPIYSFVSGNGLPAVSLRVATELRIGALLDSMYGLRNYSSTVVSEVKYLQHLKNVHLIEYCNLVCSRKLQQSITNI